MTIVLLLETLLSCRAEVVAADSDDIITAVRRGVVDGLVLAH
jgi:predicted solute-binding protein